MKKELLDGFISRKFKSKQSLTPDDRCHDPSYLWDVEEV